MRDQERIDDIVEQIRLTWKASPDMRLGQLICNAMLMSGDQPEDVTNFWSTLYNLEDPMLSYGLGQLFGVVTNTNNNYAATQPRQRRRPNQDESDDRTNPG